MIPALLFLFAASDDSSLVEAVKHQERATALALVKTQKGINVPAADGSTPLHWAAHWSDVDLVNRLLQAGAGVDARSRFGVTPLALACTSGNGAVVGMLLKAKGLSQNN